MAKPPHVIRTEMGDGLRTLVPWGVTVDVSRAARRLHARLAELARERRRVGKSRAK
jgi:hypothetical protein